MKERRDYWPYTDGRVLEPAFDGKTWPCGHPKTQANTAHIGKAGFRCRICRRKIWRDHWRRKAVAWRT